MVADANHNGVVAFSFALIAGKSFTKTIIVAAVTIHVGQYNIGNIDIPPKI